MPTRLSLLVRDLCNWFKRFFKLNYLGIFFGIIGYYLALTPSLMPRPTLFLGIVAGLGFCMGYAVGLLISFTYRWIGFREPSQLLKSYIWQSSLILGPALVIIFGLGRDGGRQLSDR